jgi:arsenate reductase-like glutaredoxin family protein
VLYHVPNCKPCDDVKEVFDQMSSDP